MIYKVAVNVEHVESFAVKFHLVSPEPIRNTSQAPGTTRNVL